MVRWRESSIRFRIMTGTTGVEVTVELLLQMMFLPAFRIGNSMWYLLKDAAV